MILGLAGCTKFRKAAVLLFLMWTGLLSGLILTVAVMQRGFGGILLCLVGVLPQLPLYTAGYLILLWFLFHSPSAGDFIVTLAWMCPFLYTNNTLLSILNGIGKTNLSFFINAISLVIRIAGVLLFIPKIGIYGYLWGLLISQCDNKISG